MSIDDIVEDYAKLGAFLGGVYGMFNAIITNSRLYESFPQETLRFLAETASGVVIGAGFGAGIALLATSVLPEAASRVRYAAGYLLGTLYVPQVKTHLFEGGAEARVEYNSSSVNPSRRAQIAKDTAGYLREQLVAAEIHNPGTLPPMTLKYGHVRIVSARGAGIGVVDSGVELNKDVGRVYVTGLTSQHEIQMAGEIVSRVAEVLGRKLHGY